MYRVRYELKREEALFVLYDRRHEDVFDRSQPGLWFFLGQWASVLLLLEALVDNHFRRSRVVRRR